jgi:hypothetical protein
MGMKTLVGAWACTLALTTMAAFASPRQTDEGIKPQLSEAQKSICSALEEQSFCE